jgi:hypothetical protein
MNYTMEFTDSAFGKKPPRATFLVLLFSVICMIVYFLSTSTKFRRDQKYRHVNRHDCLLVCSPQGVLSCDETVWVRVAPSNEHERKVDLHVIEKASACRSKDDVK